MFGYYLSPFVARQISALVCGISLLLFAPPYKSQSVSPQANAQATIDSDRIERSIQFICQDQTQDPKATVPIDKMATQPLMALTAPQVIAGRNKAQSMLAVAKRLLPFALSRVAANNGLEPLSAKWIVERVRSITAIRPDVSEADNAAWRPSEANTIVFGTIFLAALGSEEAMLAVLAHEITHAIDGTDNSLEPLFRRVSQRSFVNGAPVEELVCELVALEVVRDYVSQTSSQRFQSRRLARPLQKNCVSIDLSDDHHLSPRQTLKMLISLDPRLNFQIKHNPKGQLAKRRANKNSKRNRKSLKGPPPSPTAKGTAEIPPSGG